MRIKDDVFHFVEIQEVLIPKSPKRKMDNAGFLRILRL